MSYTLTLLKTEALHPLSLLTLLCPWLWTYHHSTNCIFYLFILLMSASFTKMCYLRTRIPLVTALYPNNRILVSIDIL